MTADVKQANEIIAKYVFYEQSEVEPDYWFCNEHGFSLLKFHEDWNWLMFAVNFVQKTHTYYFKNQPYSLETECLYLAKFITQIKLNRLKCLK